MVEVSYTGLMVFFVLYCLALVINSAYLVREHPRKRTHVSLGGDVFGFIINLVIVYWLGSVLF